MAVGGGGTDGWQVVMELGLGVGIIFIMQSHTGNEKRQVEKVLTQCDLWAPHVGVKIEFL